MKRRDEFLVGLLLAGAVVIGLGGTIWIARGGLARNYPMYARFPWGAGLRQGQPVLLAGVQVGFVDRVQLDPNGTLLVDLKVHNQYRVPKGSTAIVQANGIFGDQLIAVLPVLGAREYLEVGDTIPTGKGSPGTAELLTKGDSIALDVRALTGKARAEFVEGGGLQDVRATLRDLTKLVGQMSSVMAEQSKQLTKTQEAVRNKVASVDSSKIDSTMTNLRAASASIEQLTRELRTTNAEVQQVMTKVSSGTGTMGKLMNDDAVYARFDSLLRRVDGLVAEFQKNPKKFVNLKIF